MEFILPQKKDSGLCPVRFPRRDSPRSRNSLSKSLRSFGNSYGHSFANPRGIPLLELIRNTPLRILKDRPLHILNDAPVQILEVSPLGILTDFPLGILEEIPLGHLQDFPLESLRISLWESSEHLVSSQEPLKSESRMGTTEMMRNPEGGQPGTLCFP